MNGTNAPVLHVAVADGATDATFAKVWANLLVTGYAAGRLTAQTLPEVTQELAREWARQVLQEPLPWHAQAKIAQHGSCAALLGVTLTEATGDYSALAVGDCALFHVRPEGECRRLIAAFPLTRSSDFSGTPVLIGTQNTVAPAHIQMHRGLLAPGDTLFLMSDALAAWFLRETENDRDPTRWLAPLGTPDGDAALTATVRELRDSDRLKNDDVTVIRMTRDRAKGEP